MKVCSATHSQHEINRVPLKIVLTVGARPNFMKAAPLMKSLSQDSDFAPVLIHTGQHYDHSMSGQFLADLDLPEPHYLLDVGSGSHAQQTAEIMKRIEPVLLKASPAAVIVFGDVNSTMAGAVVAAKLGIKVVHVEAGLRSFDRSMPEEINRIVTDSVSDLFLVTEESARSNLLREGIDPAKIHLTGNLMIDSLQCHLDRALRSDVRSRLSINASRFGLVTLHRPSNVDTEDRFVEILEALSVISNELPLYWPVHPRTRARLESCCISVPNNLHLLNPLGYLDFLCLHAHSALVLTDSGGIQEEATVLGVPCLTLRDNTERPITLECGTNRLAGTRKETILRAWKLVATKARKPQTPPLWDGKASARCHAQLRRFLMNNSLIELRAS